MLHLAKDDRTVAILHFIEDGDPEGGLRIPRINRHIIKDFEQGRPRVPTAYRGVDRIDDVLSGETRNWHPEEVSLSIAALSQEWHQAILDLIPSCLLPAHSSLVHFIDDNDELGDAERASQLNVLSSLSVLLEASLELTTPGGDD